MVVERGEAGEFAGFDLGDRVLEHLLVKLVADFLDVARLFLAQQIPCPAQVEVMRGEVEARAEAVETAEQAQAFHGLRGQRGAGVGGEEAIGAGL